MLHLDSSMRDFRAAHPYYWTFASRRRYRKFPERVAALNKAQREKVQGETLKTASQRGERWTQKDLEFIRDHPEMTSKVLALRLGRTWAGIHAQRQLHCFKTPREPIFRVLELEYEI